jgi:hypothetical protein
MVFFKRIGKFFSGFGKRINQGVDIFNKGLGLYNQLPKDTQDLVEDRALDVAEGRRIDYSPPVRQFLKDHEKTNISSLTVRRQPIQQAINKAFQLLTGGSWEKSKEQLGYDKLYHLSLIVNGDTIIEKNEVVKVAQAPPKSDAAEEINVPVKGTVSITQLLHNTRQNMGDSDYFLYDAFKNNCQVFVLSILKYNHLLTPEIERFIDQSAYKLLEKNPSYTQGLAQAVTSLGALVDVAKFGK